MNVPEQNQEIVVFIVHRDSACAECGTELPRKSFLRMERDKPLCMACADLDRLEYLPRGDTAVTRRAKKRSKLWAVVVEWSRSRKRYERQRLLVEPEAIDQAVEESEADAGERERRHAHTDYDGLLARYGDRTLARQEVRARIEELLDAWSARP